MNRLTVWLLFAVLCGCASHKPRDPTNPTGTNSDTITVPSPTKLSTGSGLERAKIHTELGVSYYENGQLGVALEELNTAVAADRSYAPAYDGLGLVYMQLKDDAQAERNFLQALKLDPNSSTTRNNHGLFLCQRGRHKEGIQQLMEALKNPLYATPDVAYKNAGVCMRKAGDDKAAQEYFLKALKLNSRQAQALYGLAELHFAHTDYSAARQYLGRYFSAVENAGPDALWLGARIERKLGDRTALANYGMQLRRRYPSSPEAKAYSEGRFE